MSYVVRDIIGEIYQELDRKIEEALTPLPEGSLLCVHNLEVKEVKDEGFDRSASAAITWTAKIHVVPHGETCTDPGRLAQYVRNPEVDRG